MASAVNETTFSNRLAVRLRSPRVLFASYLVNKAFLMSREAVIICLVVLKRAGFAANRAGEHEHSGPCLPSVILQTDKYLCSKFAKNSFKQSLAERIEKRTT
jgi:hypothetical protein